ncbi:MAG: SPOR domain-containing protein [Ignavibacteriaceae bacterium]
MKITLILSLLLLFLSSGIFPQEKNISSYLKKIEDGERDAVKTETAQLIKSNPTDPSLIFLSAVLMDDADDAVKKFTLVYQNYPKSNYAHAAVYRLYLYFYAVGSYMKAQGFANKLRTDYPNSSYVKMIHQVSDSPNNQQKETEQKPEIKDEKKTPDSYYSIQVGAFTNPKNSADLKKKLETKKLTVEIREKVVGGTELLIVYAGKYSSKAEAEESLDLIQKSFAIEGRIIQITD